MVMQPSRFIAIHPSLIWSITLAALAFEEDTLKGNEIIALPMLIVAVILFAASFDTKIYYSYNQVFRNATNSKKI